MRAGPSRAVDSGRVIASPGLAALISVLLLLIALPTGALWSPTALVVQLGCSFLGGMALLRPLMSGVLLGVLVTSLAVFPSFTMGLAVLALTIPIMVSAIRGHRIAAVLFAGWYLAVSIGLTAEVVQSGIDLAIGVNFWVVFMLAPLLLGEVIRRQQERAERQRRVQALATERQRRAIARDLHDTLVYATTTMVMRAEQARLRGGHDDQTLSDLDFIAATGRSASADLRTMLAMLRDTASEVHDDPDPLGLLPTSRLEEVVAAQTAKLEAFNFQVNVSSSGDPAALPDRVSTIVARVITEAASNITKHGDPCEDVSVMLDFEEREIEAVVVNAIRSDEPVIGHRGVGLLGLREIVEAEGGALTSALVGGRWITHLALPAGDRVREGGHGG